MAVDTAGTDRDRARPAVNRAVALETNGLINRAVAANLGMRVVARGAAKAALAVLEARGEGESDRLKPNDLAVLLRERRRRYAAGGPVALAALEDLLHRR